MNDCCPLCGMNPAVHQRELADTVKLANAYLAELDPSSRSWRMGDE